MSLFCLGDSCSEYLRAQVVPCHCTHRIRFEVVSELIVCFDPFPKDLAWESFRCYVQNWSLHSSTYLESRSLSEEDVKAPFPETHG